MIQTKKGLSIYTKTRLISSLATLPVFITIFIMFKTSDDIQDFFEIIQKTKIFFIIYLVIVTIALIAIPIINKKR